MGGEGSGRRPDVIKMVQNQTKQLVHYIPEQEGQVEIPNYSGVKNYLKDPTSSGGTIGTTGSVLFVGTNGQISQDNTNLFWDDTNNRLGIGTASPRSILTLSSPTTSLNPILSLENSGAFAAAEPDIEFFNSAGNIIHGRISSFPGTSYQNSVLRFWVANSGKTITERMRIDVNGNVGIGTPSPAFNLDLSGTANVSGTLSGSAVGGIVVGTTTTQTLSAKTLTTPVLSGTPAADAALGWDATQDAPNVYSTNTGAAATIPKVVAAGTGTQTLTNSTAADQDFTSVWTIPANALFTNKVYRVTLNFEFVTGAVAITAIHYLKLGATKVYINTATDFTNSVTRSAFSQFYIFGQAAVGGAANTSTMGFNLKWGGSSDNTVNQPVALATNGTLAITPGVTYSGTGSTETMELQGWLVEELN